MLEQILTGGNIIICLQSQPREEKTTLFSKDRFHDAGMMRIRCGTSSYGSMMGDLLGPMEVRVVSYISIESKIPRGYKIRKFKIGFQSKSSRR